MFHTRANKLLGEVILPCSAHLGDKDGLELGRVKALLHLSKYFGNSINDKSNHHLSIKHSSSPLFPVLLDVAESDEGTYSCNLHHHYCHLYETVKVQLAVTKKGKCGRHLGVPSCKGTGLAAGSPWPPALC